jgi:hypothetical protein
MAARVVQHCFRLNRRSAFALFSLSRTRRYALIQLDRRTLRSDGNCSAEIPLHGGLRVCHRTHSPANRRNAVDASPFALSPTGAGHQLLKNRQERYCFHSRGVMSGARHVTVAVLP